MIQGLNCSSCCSFAARGSASRRVLNEPTRTRYTFGVPPGGVRTPSAQTSVAVKLASVVPENSIWDKNLKQMAGEWGEATGGRVSVTVFSGGTQGDEPTVLRKMRLDALQAA